MKAVIRQEVNAIAFVSGNIACAAMEMTFIQSGGEDGKQIKEQEAAGVSKLKHHTLFLRMAAIELRRIAEDAPAVGTRLQQSIR